MALTRFRLPLSGTAPASPASQTYTHTQAIARRPLPTSDSTTLTTQAYAPDGADHIVAGDSLHVQLVSATIAVGTVINSGATVKLAIQGLEAHTNNNLFVQLWVGVCNSDNTLAATLLGKTVDATELATSLTNRFFSATTSAGHTFTANQHLFIEISVQGTPAASGGVQGHNASLRWGANGAGGDLGENDTDTGTTLNPWFEIDMVTNQDVSGTHIASTVLNAGSVAVSVEGAHVASTSLFAGSVAVAVDGAHVFTTQMFAGTVDTGEQNVTGAHISGTQIFTGSVVLGIDGAFISGTQIFIGSVGVGVFGVPITTTQMFAGSILSDVGGAFIGPTVTTFAGTVEMAVSGAHVASTQLFAGIVSEAGAVAGAHISSTQIFAGTIALDVAGAHITTTTLNAGGISPVVEGAFIGPTSTTFAGAVAVEANGASISSSQLFAGTVAVTVTGAHISSTQLFSGYVGFQAQSPRYTVRAGTHVTRVQSEAGVITVQALNSSIRTVKGQISSVRIIRVGE